MGKLSDAARAFLKEAAVVKITGAENGMSLRLWRAGLVQRDVRYSFLRSLQRGGHYAMNTLTDAGRAALEGET